MRVRQGRQCWGLMLVLAATAAGARQPIGPDGPSWMRPAASRPAGRQAGTPPTPDVNITRSAGDDRDACWSPDGTVIAFASNRAGSYDIYTCRRDGSHPDSGAAFTPKVISNLSGDERYPAWSPGGTELAYVRGSAIYIRNLRTNVESLVSDQVGTPTGLAFSFDGARLAFAARIGADLATNIYWIAVDPNNRVLQRVTDTPFNNLAPAWFPESGRILFASERDGAYDVYMVTSIPGPGGAAVAENTWTKVVGGVGDQTEPAWVNVTGTTINADIATVTGQVGVYNQNYHVLYADDEGNPSSDVKVVDGDGDSISGTGDIVFSDLSGTSPGDQSEPFALPQQSATQNYCVYTGNQAGNYELYTIAIFDFSPPILSDGLEAALPSVTPQKTFPGATVKIAAPVFDIGSGVAEVYAVVRYAERPVFQRSATITGDGGNQGVINSSGGDRVAMGFLNIECEQLVVNPTTYGAIDPTSLTITRASLVNWVRNVVGIRLYDDGSHGDDVGGDMVYSADWVVPPAAEDYYLDIVPFDSRGNVPVDLDLGRNSRPGGGDNPLRGMQQGFAAPFHVIGYDHVTGFTARQLDLTRKILFVSDYACGQKFQVADFAGTDQTTLNRFWPAALPTEHWYFGTDDDNSLTQAGLPGFQLVGANPPTVHRFANPYFGGVSFNPPLGYTTGDEAFCERLGGLQPFGGPAQADRLAVWRVLCRGPVDASTYNAYAPLPLTQPSGSPVPAQDADRMVVWVAPYTGNLFVHPGTLLDADVQSALTSFQGSGGRLFVTGQDIAWALTKNGTQANTFLSSALRATFVSDASSDVVNQTVQSGQLRRDFTNAGGLNAIERAVYPQMPADRNPIIDDLYPDFYRWSLWHGEYHPPSAGDSLLRINAGWFGGGPNWAGDGCPNGWFIDDITATNGATASLNYSNGGATAMLRHIDSGTGSRLIYCAFPFESWRNNYRYYSGYEPNTNYVICHNSRVETMTNISDYLRTGGLLGKVVGPDGATPVGGVTVVARQGFLPTGQIMSTTTSLNDGTYLLRGLSTGNYSMYVVSSEYTADHRPYQPVFGGQISQDSDLTIRLLRFDTGTIYGTVRDTSGAARSGASITVTLQTTATNPLVYPAPGDPPLLTDNNGNYSINVPGGTYTVKATLAGFGSVSQTDVVVVPGDQVQVDLTLQPAPGRLAGTVRGNNSPVSGAGIAVLRNGLAVATATTNAGGQYGLDLGAGTYDVVVTAAGFQQGRSDGAVVTSDQTTTVDFTLQAVPPGSLVGQVTLQGSSEAVGGVNVNLVGGGAVLQTVTSAASFTVADGATYNYRFDNVPAGTYDVAISARGYSAPTRTAITVASSAVTRDVNFSLQPLHTFIAGLSMTSAPFDYTSSAPDLQTLIDDDSNAATNLKMAAYDTLGRRYIYYPNQPANTFKLGTGYFLRLSRNVPLTTEGIRAPEVGNGFDIQLLAGWNLIGHVYDFPVDLFGCKVLFQGQELTLQEAAARGLVNASLYTLNFGQYQQVFRLDPYTAYWVRAFQNVQLRVPPTALRSVTTARSTRQAATPESWLAQIQAQAGELQASASFGVAADAGQVYDRHDRAAPPAPPEQAFLQLSFPHPDWGRYADQYVSDVRGRGSSQRWLLEVRCDQAGVPVELSWPQLGASVPGDQRVLLEDLATGQRRSLRHTGSYRYDSAAGGRRQFAVVVEPATDRPRILQAGFSGGRGSGGQITWTLSAPLDLTVEIRGAAGAVVRRLSATGRAAGSGGLNWDGRDEQGRPVPNGAYRIVLVGLSPTGEQVREVRTIQYRR
ncbi:MAG: carboxypeptidase regulatory-like domain-containing protein [Fimbriimonadaceae bacterium]|nr:carboxypeptidase regulatory-like domain-containing protein [Fimbriimonadaceae bacterium]